MEKFFEIFLFVHSFQVNCQNNYTGILGKNFEGIVPPYNRSKWGPLPLGLPTLMPDYKSISV